MTNLIISPIPLDGIPNLSYDNATNRITTTGYEYDAAGNQIRSLAADGVNWLLYEYDAANRLRTVKKDDTNHTSLQAFQYGSTNARVMSLEHLTGQWTIYGSVGGTAMAEYTEYTSTVPTWTKSYTYFGDTQLATVTPNGTGGEYVEFNHPDRLGTRLMTNQAGGTSYEQTHLPFGTALNAESTGSTNNRFTSYDRSEPTGLDYALNRTYDNKLGRFTQVDPIRMSDAHLVNPQSFNLYSYCQNDPVNHLDPSGLGFFSFLKKLLKWAMIAVAIVVAIALVIIAAAVVAAVVFNVTLPSFLGGSGFLGALLGIFNKIGLGASSFVAGAFGIEISSSTGGSFALGLLFGVGAIANSFQNDDKKKKKKKSKTRIEPGLGTLFCYTPKGQKVMFKDWHVLPDEIMNAARKGLEAENLGWNSFMTDGVSNIRSLGWIIANESTGEVGVQNRDGSSARGLGQLMPPNWKYYPHGEQSLGNAVEEVQGIIRYSKDRYGTLKKAKEFWMKNCWY